MNGRRGGSEFSLVASRTIGLDTAFCPTRLIANFKRLRALFPLRVSDRPPPPPPPPPPVLYRRPLRRSLAIRFLLYPRSVSTRAFAMTWIEERERCAHYFRDGLTHGLFSAIECALVRPPPTCFVSFPSFLRRCAFDGFVTRISRRFELGSFRGFVHRPVNQTAH
jgi:hypothetical protein